MTLKETLVELCSSANTELANDQLLDLLTENDDLTEIICEYNIPFFIRCICNDEFLSKKEYAFKYKDIAPFYRDSDYANTHSQELIGKPISFFIDNILPYADYDIIRSIYNCFRERTDNYYSLINLENSVTDSSILKALDKIIKKEETYLNSILDIRSLFEKYRRKDYGPFCRIEKLLDDPRLLAPLEAEENAEDDIYYQHKVLEDKVIALNSEIEELASLNEKLRSEKDALLGDISAKESEISGLTEKITKLEEATDNLTRINSNLQQNMLQYQDLENINDTLQDQCEELQKEQIKSKNALARASSRVFGAIQSSLSEIELQLSIAKNLKTPITRAHIEAIMSAVCELRKSLEDIDLGSGYHISIKPCISEEIWKKQVEIPYDETIHFRGRPGTNVIVRSRGYIYPDMNGELVTDPAEVYAGETAQVECSTPSPEKAVDSGDDKMPVEDNKTTVITDDPDILMPDFDTSDEITGHMSEEEAIEE